MYNDHDVTDIKSLTLLEQVLAFLHRRGLPFSADALASHLEEAKEELNVRDLPPEISRYLEDRRWEYHEAEIQETYLTKSRIDLFRHPRFAPVNIHSHSYFEIKYLLSGQANVLIAGHTLILGAGDLLFLAPGVEHVVNIYDDESILINIIITPDAARSAFPRLNYSENPFSLFFAAGLQGRSDAHFLLCRTGGDDTVRELILNAYHKRRSPGPLPFYLLCESIIEQMMLEVLSSSSAEFEQTVGSPAVPEKLFPILGYINDHCTSVNLTSLAQVFSYSPAHLSRLIKQHTGKTFSELLRSARLTQASILLRSTDLSIQEIMLRSGYAGKAHFYRVFQAAYGMPPAQFRARKGSE